MKNFLNISSRIQLLDDIEIFTLESLITLLSKTEKQKITQIRNVLNEKFENMKIQNIYTIIAIKYMQSNDLDRNL